VAKRLFEERQASGTGEAVKALGQMTRHQARRLYYRWARTAASFPVEMELRDAIAADAMGYFLGYRLGSRSR